MSAEATETAVMALLRSFSPRSGRWRTPTGEAWQPALAVEAVLLAYELTGAVSLLNVVEKSFSRYRGRRSRFFDDDGWYLNAWLRAYDVTGDTKYLAEARDLFETMTHGWDGHCRGGLWWNADRTYKNAITNELFILASARLARRTEVRRYGNWARKAWYWFDASGMINMEGLVNDGLDSTCANNGQPTWSYNQGVILGALVELWRLTGEESLLARATQIATAAMQANVHSGRMIVCEPDSDWSAVGNRDAHGFKGVFAQGLARLHAVLLVTDPDSAAAIRAFLVANAASVWRDATGVFGLSWLAAADAAQPVNAATRASAALLLGSVALADVGGETAEPPPSAGVRLEAERAGLVGVGTESIHPGHTGDGYVAGWRNDGQAVVFTVRDLGARDVGARDVGAWDVGAWDARPRGAGAGDAGARRSAVLSLRYAAGAGDAHRRVMVDGVERADRLLFTATGGWDRYATVSLDAGLRPGSTVEVSFDRARGSRNHLNLDSLTVRYR